MNKRKMIASTTDWKLYEIQSDITSKKVVIIATGNILDWRPMNFQKPIY